MGAAPETNMPVVCCTPETMRERMMQALTSNLVPLLLSGYTLAESQGSQKGIALPAPLWCLSRGQHGCSPETTVHLAYASAERRRCRDFNQAFRSAITEALLSYRWFALVFGDGAAIENNDNATEEAERPPPSWALPGLLHESSLPADLFDPLYFRASGCASSFLPANLQKGQISGPPAQATEPDAAEGDGLEQGEDTVTRASLPAPTTYFLRFALVSCRRLPRAQMDDDDIRRHVGRRFGKHVPLHRVMAIVVDAPEVEELSVADVNWPRDTVSK